MPITRLNDLQLILLSAAASRDNGSLMPFPDTVTVDVARLGTAVQSLLKRQLIEERPVIDRKLAFREEGDNPSGVFITDAGRSAIGADEVTGSGATPTPLASRASGEAASRAAKKTDIVLGLLKRSEGATLAELVEATGWLPHTTRAHLTGLRKKGHTIEKTKRNDVTCYRIAEGG